MKKYKNVLFVTFVILFCFGAFVYANNVVSQSSTLSGVVSSKGLVKKGDVVKEGQVLLIVESVAGEVPAARATIDGEVVEVLVQSGDNIKSGQTIAKIESK